MKREKPPRSLKSKALQLLAQREQSRLELRRKLMAHAVAEALAQVSPRGDSPVDDGDAASSDDDAVSQDATLRSARTASTPPGRGADTLGDAPSAREAASTAARRVDEVLAWLDAQRFQSDTRFAESRVNARAGRYGDLRIRQELKQHGIALAPDAARALGHTERSRAWAVWQRRFGEAPATAAELAKQSRFLAARGFSPDSVRHVLQRARAARSFPEAVLDDD